MSRSSQKHCGYYNSSELQQKSSHSKYQYFGSEKLEANWRSVLPYKFTSISSYKCIQQKCYFHALLIKGVVLSLAFYGLSSSTGKTSLLSNFHTRQVVYSGNHITIWSCLILRVFSMSALQVLNPFWELRLLSF